MHPVQPDIAADFLVEAEEIVARLGDDLVQLELRPDDSEILNSVFRGFHTIKGGASFLDMPGMVALCHVVEELFDALRRGRLDVHAGVFDLAQAAADELTQMLAALRAGAHMKPAAKTLLDGLHAALGAVPRQSPELPAAAGTDAISDDEFEAMLDELHGNGAPAMAAPVATTRSAGPASSPSETSVRVDTRRLDDIMNLVGELVLARNRLKTLRRRVRDEELDRAIGMLDVVTTRMQTNIMRVRMQPISRVFSRFPKLARDVARQLGKEVHVALIGEDTELDKNLVEALADPLIHLVRNAIDHGIEISATREKMGKPRVGKLELAARQEGDHIVITVADDGAGMDPDLLRAKAREKGVIDAETAARMTPDECLQLIFAAGFSTKDVATDISGRGVGMDVVKARLKELGGQVTIESQTGCGSRFVIRVPLTLAILPTLLVAVGGRQYALPMACVQEVLEFKSDDVRYIDGCQILDLRGETLPLIFLRRWLGIDQTTGASNCVVVVQSGGGGRTGIVIDQVRGREEVLIKPLPAAVRGLAGLAGATIISDGSLALILDVTGLARS
jgi:two-component system, chemotaxis family, sensor kinase CheA